VTGLKEPSLLSWRFAEQISCVPENKREQNKGDAREVDRGASPEFVSELLRWETSSLLKNSDSCNSSATGVFTGVGSKRRKAGFPPIRKWQTQDPRAAQGPIPGPAGRVIPRLQKPINQGEPMKTKATTWLAGVALAGALLFSAAPSAEARDRGSRTPRIDRREANQKHRIQQGVRSGELTRRETARLAAEQARIRAMERRARSDGDVTARERARLQRELNQSSRHIYRQKHDRQDRN